MPASQAGRRGFDPRLPLFVSNSYRPASFRNTPFTPLRKLCDFTYYSAMKIVFLAGTRFLVRLAVDRGLLSQFFIAECTVPSCPTMFGRSSWTATTHRRFLLP